MNDSKPDGRRLRVVAFTSIDLSLPQGHAVHLRALLDAFATRGHAVDLVAPAPSGSRPPIRCAVAWIPIPRGTALGLGWFEIAGGIALFLRGLRRRPDCVWTRQDLYTAAPAIVARLLRVPLVAQVNASIPEELAFAGKRAAARIATACERFTLRRAARVVVLAEEHGDALAARAGIDRSRIVAIPVGARIPAESDPRVARAEHSLAPSTFLVGFAGNLAPIQGVDRLLEAFARLSERDAALWIIGMGTEEARLRARAAGLSGRIRFFGGVAPEEADRWLSACQILVAPYRRDAYLRVSAGGALSSKVVWYLAVDRPVLVADLPAYAWIESLGAGERVDCEDPAALAAAILVWEERWRDAGAPIGAWPGPSPRPGRCFVERERLWNRSAERLEVAIAAVSSAARRARSQGR